MACAEARRCVLAAAGLLLCAAAGRCEADGLATTAGNLRGQVLACWGEQLALRERSTPLCPQRIGLVEQATQGALAAAREPAQAPGEQHEDSQHENEG